MDLRSVERVVAFAGRGSGRSHQGSRSELPPGAKPRSGPEAGMALKYSVTVNFGTIDPGYRGEIRVIMFNLGRADYTVEKGDKNRAVDHVSPKYVPVEWEEGELGDSLRGQGGFGSSGR